MQYYDINIPANKQQIVEAQGTFIYYLSGNAGGADNTIKVTFGLGGTTVLLKPGQSIRLPLTAKPIDMWRVENYANAQTIVGQVLVGAGDFKDTNTTGTVQVVDGGKSRTLSGSAFGGTVYLAAQGAGNTSAVQIWNPSGSGKNVVVEQIYATSLAGATAQSFSYGINAAALTTLYAGQNNAQSKKAGGSASTAQFRTQSITAALGVNMGYMPQAIFYKLTEPVVILPGYGMWVSQIAANQDVAAAFEFYEENQ